MVLSHAHANFFKAPHILSRRRIAPEPRPVEIKNDVELQKMPSEDLVETKPEQSTSPAAQTQADEPRNSRTDNQNRPGHIVWAADPRHGQSLRIPPPLAQEKGMTATVWYERRRLTILTQVPNLTLCKMATTTQPLITTKTLSQSRQESRIVSKLTESPCKSGVHSP